MRSLRVALAQNVSTLKQNYKHRKGGGNGGKEEAGGRDGHMKLK